MRLGKMNYKKSLKLVALVISSLLIATASAQVYRYMYIDGSVTVTTSKLIWILGADAPADASIAGSTVTIDLDVEQGTPLNFTEALFLKNVNATGSFSYTIRMTTAVSSSDFQRANMYIDENYTVPWTNLKTLDMTNAADSYSNSLAADNYLRMTFEVNATNTAGPYNFDIEVEYEA